MIGYEVDPGVAAIARECGEHPHPLQARFAELLALVLDEAIDLGTDARGLALERLRSECRARRARLRAAR